MVQKIRVSVEYPGGGGTTYYDLPDEWGGMSEAERQDYLSEMATEELSNYDIGSGASVVDFPERGE